MHYSFIVLFLLSLCISTAKAGGERAVAERILYYLADVAEEIYVTDGVYTIAPGCKGTAAGGRCGLVEFMVYTLKEPAGYPKLLLAQAPKTDLNQVKTLKALLKRDYDKLFSQMLSWRSNPKGTPYIYTLTELTDTEKLLPHATDWYDGLSKSTAPISRLKRFIQELKPPPDDAGRKETEEAADTKNNAIKLDKLADSAALRVEELRRLEFENGADGFGKGRLRAIEEQVRTELQVPKDSPPIIQSVKDPNLSGCGRDQKSKFFDRLDVSGTLIKNRDAYPAIETALEAACNEYKTKNDLNIAHRQALNAAIEAREGTRLPGPNEQVCEI